MVRTSLDRRSTAVGAFALAITQALLAGAFWIGFRSGHSHELAEQTDPAFTGSPMAGTPATTGEDPCAESFIEPGVCLLGSSFEIDGSLIVELEYRNINAGEVGFDGIHAHLFPSDVPVELVGTAGAASIGGGDWTVADATTLRVSADDQGYLLRTGHLCTATAGPTHTLLHLHASCAPIGA